MNAIDSRRPTCARVLRDVGPPLVLGIGSLVAVLIGSCDSSSSARAIGTGAVVVGSACMVCSVVWRCLSHA